MSLTIEHLTGGYGHIPVLKDINFDVKSGEMVGLINELEDYRSLKNQVTNDWDQVQRNLAVVEENVPLATEFSKDLQQEITDFKFQAEPRIAQIKEQIAKITAELPDTQTNKQK